MSKFDSGFENDISIETGKTSKIEPEGPHKANIEVKQGFKPKKLRGISKSELDKYVFVERHRAGQRRNKETGQVEKVKAETKRVSFQNSIELERELNKFLVGLERKTGKPVNRSEFIREAVLRHIRNCQ